MDDSDNPDVMLAFLSPAAIAPTAVRVAWSWHLTTSLRIDNTGMTFRLQAQVLPPKASLYSEPGAENED